MEKISPPFQLFTNYSQINSLKNTFHMYTTLMRHFIGLTQKDIFNLRKDKTSLLYICFTLEANYRAIPKIF